MNIMNILKSSPLCAGVIVSAFLMGAPCAQAALVVEPHPTNALCADVDVADLNGNPATPVSVENCIPANSSGPTFDEIIINGSGQVIAPLVANHSCVSGGVSNSGVIIRQCNDVNNRSQAVVSLVSAPAANPTQLNPLPILSGLSLTPDVSSAPTAYSQTGHVVGISMSADAKSTAVLWLSGTATPVIVSNKNDNCVPIGVTDTPASTRPVVLLDCPENGYAVGKVATATGLLGAYVETALANPANATNCVAIDINNLNHVLGTCIINTEQSEAAFWVSAATAPTTTTGTTRNGGVDLNDNDHAVGGYQAPNGESGGYFWNPTTGALNLLNPVSGGNHLSPVCIGDNDVIAAVSDDSNGNSQAAHYLSGSSTATADGFADGGHQSGFTACSKSGHTFVGVIESGTHHPEGVEIHIP